MAKKPAAKRKPIARARTNWKALYEQARKSHATQIRATQETAMASARTLIIAAQQERDALKTVIFNLRSQQSILNRQDAQIRTIVASWLRSPGTPKKPAVVLRSIAQALDITA